MKNIFYAFGLLLTFGWSVNLDAQPFDVVWTGAVGVSVNGNSLTKTASSGWGNGGAASVNFIPANTDGYVEVTASETDKSRLIGLAENTDFNTIEFTIYLRSSGIVSVFESGTPKGDFGPYTTGDILKVERVGNQILYKKNGTTFYISALTSTSQLFVNCQLNHINSTIQNAVISHDTSGSSGGGGTTNWQLNNNNIFYDAGIVSVNTANSTKAFSVENTTSGNTEFQVNGDGKVYAREVEVTLNAFPDYVFEEEYPLMPLEDLKEYIEKNGHLPNIPKGEDIDNNGIGLGDLSHKQMEKIEELTLYILQLDDRLQKLEKENIDLKKEVKRLRN